MTGFQFIEADEVVPQKPLFIVVSGIPGIGKTSAAFTAGNALCIDADLGIQRAIQKKRPLSVRISKYNDFRAQIFSPQFEVMVKERDIENVLIDTIGALLDDVIAPYLIASDHKNGRSGGLSLQGWGALASEFNLLIERFFTLGLNVIAVCHAKDDEDEATKAKLITLAVKGGSREVILRKADMVGFIQLRNGQRILDFNKSPNVFVAKNTAELAPSEVPNGETPEYLDFMSRIMQATNDRMSAMSEAQLEAVRLQTAITAKIDTLTSLADVPTLEAEINALSVETVRLGALSSLGSRYAEIVLEDFKPKNAKAVNDFVKALGAHPEAYKKIIWGRLVEAASGMGFYYDKPSKAFKALKTENAAENETAETTENEATDGEA